MKGGIALNRSSGSVLPTGISQAVVRYSCEPPAVFIRAYECQYQQGRVPQPRMSHLEPSTPPCPASPLPYSAATKKRTLGIGNRQD
ncbi:hypothetical protein E2C01_026324 [Portunus trituberculatus]|uniref:Uncharacterized protein n=1 Tax=Portunus trituberculatus TaxID=210409 RepID=A0A5B7EIG3_PORTR|nr:hypothetical protein [Portunus trituberculatus]